MIVLRVVIASSLRIARRLDRFPFLLANGIEMSFYCSRKFLLFADEFDASVVADFYVRDANRDGVITPNEWNRFLANQNKENNADLAPDKD
jgi:hypothetical protein